MNEEKGGVARFPARPVRKGCPIQLTSMRHKYFYILCTASQVFKENVTGLAILYNGRKATSKTSKHYVLVVFRPFLVICVQKLGLR